MPGWADRAVDGIGEGGVLFFLGYEFNYLATFCFSLGGYNSSSLGFWSEFRFNVGFLALDDEGVGD